MGPERWRARWATLRPRGPWELTLERTPVLSLQRPHGHHRLPAGHHLTGSTAPCSIEGLMPPWLPPTLLRREVSSAGSGQGLRGGWEVLGNLSSPRALSWKWEEAARLGGAGLALVQVEN